MIDLVAHLFYTSNKQVKPIINLLKPGELACSYKLMKQGDYDEQLNWAYSFLHIQLYVNGGFIMLKKSVTAVIIVIFFLLASSFAFAETLVPDSGQPYAFCAWNGGTDSAGYKKTLQGHGLEVVMTVGNYSSSNSDWLCVTAPHGNFYLQNSQSPYELVNVTRILQYGTYYNCRGYSYESTTNGRDQRLVRTGSYIRLADPIMGGTWYLQTDKSALSSTSDVIFYTGTGLKAQWECIDPYF